MARQVRSLGALGPFSLLFATGIWLRLHWGQIPERFATHWNLAGKPNGWGTRTPTGVLQPLIIAAATCVFLLIVRSAMRSGFPADLSHRDSRWQSMRVLGGTAWLVAGVFSFVALQPLYARTLSLPWLLGGVLVITAALLIPMLRAAMNPSNTSTPKPPANVWRWGIFYYNPDDPALMVQKRFGIGYTLNFANSKSWLLLLAALLLPLAATLLTKFLPHNY